MVLLFESLHFQFEMKMSEPVHGTSLKKTRLSETGQGLYQIRLFSKLMSC